jgi:CheY-like chemotaxis protein
MMLERHQDAAMPAEARGTRSILVAEDELLIRLCVSQELRHAGYVVYEAAEAGDALTILDGKSIDLLITDIRMPGALDGLGLAQRVRADHPQTRIMLLSAYITRETEMFDGAFPKPVRIADLIAGVKKLVPSAAKTVG